MCSIFRKRGRASKVYRGTFILGASWHSCSTSLLSAVDEVPATQISAVNKHVTDSKLDLPSNEERDRILLHFSALCPPSDIKTMADVINAGWKLRLDWKPWDGFEFDEDVKHDILNDLVFKSMEVLEFETKVGKKIPC